MQSLPDANAPAIVNDVVKLPQFFPHGSPQLGHDQKPRIEGTKTANLILETFDWPALHMDVV